MAWPRGVSRKDYMKAKAAKEAEGTYEVPGPPPVKGTVAPGKKRWKMKAAPEGWELDGMPAEESQDRFFIRRDDFPEGMDLQWVTHSVMGMEMPQERRKFENRRWTPVYQEDFDGIFNGRWMPRDAPGEINVDGMVLMARPMEYSIVSRETELRRAREQVRIKEQAWRTGEAINASGATDPSARGYNRINRSYERLDVPE